MPNEGGFETRPHKNHRRSVASRPRFGVRLAHMRLPCPQAGGLGAMVISGPTAPVKKLLRGCKNREIASISILNERYTRLRIATTLRVCLSQRLKHHSNFRPILAALGRGAGR